MRYLIIALLVALAGNTVAQVITTDTIVVQTITFESTDVTGKVKQLNAPVKNSVGMGILSWANGYLPVYYERYILDFMSIKVGAGLTFRSFCNDLGQLIWNDGRASNTFGSYSYNGSNVYDSYYRYSYRKGGVGYYIAFAPKFYPRSVAMDGFNIYPMLEFKQYNYSARKALTNVTVQSVNSSDADYDYSGSSIPRQAVYSHKEYDRCLDFTVNIGGHHQTSKSFFIEWRIGAGIRKNWSSRLDVGYEQIGSSSSYYDNYQYRNATYTYSKIKPVVGFDIVLGGLFSTKEKPKKIKKIVDEDPAAKPRW